jgi:putative phosphoesterase
MKLLILSDTHGNYPLAIKAIEQAGQVDQIVHLGDDMEDAFIIERIIGQPVIKVPGNCDFAAKVPRELCKSIAQKNILLTHGDKYNVKAGLAQLHKKALAERAHIVLYGHSHLAGIETIEEILFVNPGCLHRSSIKPTYATLNIFSGEVSAQIIPVQGP